MKRDVHHVGEERNPPESGEPAREGAAHPFELPEHDHQSGPKHHHQKEQRGWVFFAVYEGEERVEPCGFAGLPPGPYMLMAEPHPRQHADSQPRAPHA
jgi:hypothetical protein